MASRRRKWRVRSTSNGDSSSPSLVSTRSKFMSDSRSSRVYEWTFSHVCLEWSSLTLSLKPSNSLRPSFDTTRNDSALAATRSASSSKRWPTYRRRTLSTSSRTFSASNNFSINVSHSTVRDVSMLMVRVLQTSDDHQIVMRATTYRTQRMCCSKKLSRSRAFSNDPHSKPCNMIVAPARSVAQSTSMAI